MARTHSRLHIAIVVSDLTVGGAQRVLTLLAAQWVEIGHRVTVVSLIDVPDDLRIAEGIERQRINAFTVKSHLLARQGALLRYQDSIDPKSVRDCFLVEPEFQSAVQRLNSTLDQLDPDICVAFGGTAGFVLAATTELGSRRKTIVREGSDPYRFPPEHLHNAVREYSFERASIVVCNSQAACEFGRTIAPGANVVHVPNPISARSTEPMEWAKPTILSVARLTQQKRIDVLLRAFARLADPDLQLALVGNGELESDLRDLAHQLQIHHQVRWLGFHPDPSSAYAAAQIFVLSSDFEGMPNALMEAMAAGLPCVATNSSSSITDLIIHEENGLIVAKEDVDGLTRALSRLIVDPALRARMGANAALSVARFEIAKVARQWEELFRH